MSCARLAGGDDFLSFTAELVAVLLFLRCFIQCLFLLARASFLVSRAENFLEADWFDGDIVFAASTCFSNAVVDKLFSLAEQMHKGAKLVTAKLPDYGLNGEVWTLERWVACEMSWGKTEFAVLMRR